MTPESTELSHVMGLVLEIDGRLTAKADAVINWNKREVEIHITEGRRVLYHQIIGIDAEFDAKVRKTRHEPEALMEGAELPANWQPLSNNERYQQWVQRKGVAA